MSTILAPFNGKKDTARAVRVAARLARASGRSLHVLVYSNDPDVPASSPELYDRAISLGTSEGIRPRVSSLPPTRFISDELVAASARRHDAMLCIPSHGLGRMALLRGSLSMDVMTYAAGPVVLVGEKCHVPETHVPVSVGRGPIVVALDGTMESEQILLAAHRWAQETSLPIDVVEVLASEPPAVLASAFASGDVIESSYLASVVNSGVFEGDDVTFDVLHGEPADEILREAEVRGASLIAMSSHVPLGVDRLLHGSVLDRVARMSTVPILAVKQRPPADADITVG